MANLNAPFGLNPVGKIGSGPSQKMSEYKVTNDAIFQGDPVALGSGVIAQCAAGAAACGVFWGANYDDSDGKPQFRNNVPASQAATAFVYDDPYQVFEVQGDAGGAAVSAQTNVGLTANYEVDTDGVNNGVSGYQLDTSGIGGSPTPVAMMITGFSTKEGRNEIGVANTVYTVLIDNHLYA